MSTDAWQILQEVRQTYTFSERRLFFEELRRLASLSSGYKGQRLIAWPDALLWVTPEMIELAAWAIKGGAKDAASR